MYEIKIHDNTTGREWTESFDSFYLFLKRYNRLRFSKKLTMLSHSNTKEV